MCSCVRCLCRTLAAWCELRNDFRSFRVDRVETLEVLDDTFRDEPGKTLADMKRRHEAQSQERGAA